MALCIHLVASVTPQPTRDVGRQRFGVSAICRMGLWFLIFCDSCHVKQPSGIPGEPGGIHKFVNLVNVEIWEIPRGALGSPGDIYGLLVYFCI